MRVLAVQFDIAWEHREANHRKVRELLAASEIGQNSLIVLPEMFASGFSMNVTKIAETPGGPTERFVRELSRELGVFIVAGVVTRGRGDRGRNEAIAINPAGELIARYAKLHPFGLGGEKDCYEAGEDVVTFPCREFTVSPLICYDLRFPEAFRRATSRGANLFCVIASWPEARIGHWITLLQARAIENQAYVVGVNRIGRDPNLNYPGRSLIVDPLGQILVDRNAHEGVIVADVVMDHVNKVRRAFPFLADQRIDL